MSQFLKTLSPDYKVQNDIGICISAVSTADIFREYFTPRSNRSIACSVKLYVH
jgi:hypothetical protein